MQQIGEQNVSFPFYFVNFAIFLSIDFCARVPSPCSIGRRTCAERSDPWHLHLNCIFGFTIATFSKYGGKGSVASLCFHLCRPPLPSPISLVHIRMGAFRYRDSDFYMTQNTSNECSDTNRERYQQQESFSRLISHRVSSRFFRRRFFLSHTSWNSNVNGYFHLLHIFGETKSVSASCEREWDRKIDARFSRLWKKWRKMAAKCNGVKSKTKAVVITCAA